MLKPISIKRINIEVSSEINQIESPMKDKQVYFSTPTELYSFKHDGSSLRKVTSPPGGLDQFAVLTLKRQLVYLIDGEFQICNERGQKIRNLSVENDIILGAINFLLRRMKLCSWQNLSNPMQDALVYQVTGFAYWNWRRAR